MARSRRPAEGERAAIGGYYPQYLMSSDLVLRRLDEGRLEWVRLADPEAGRLDDFQIGTPARVDAYQFKWSSQPSTFNYADLIQEKWDAQTNDLVRPSLIAQLADGWQRLRSAHSGKRVVVRLVTNDIPGPNTAQIPVGNPLPARPTFASFLSEGWAAARSGAAPPAWQSALGRLRDLTGLNPNDFNDFLRDCELEFGASLPLQSSETREASLRWMNLQTLVSHIQATIQRGNVIEVRADQLLRSLGWEGRYSSKFRHEFPDPNVPYRPISTTVGRLENRIAGLRGGYLAVIGPPGSGKSVLLTKSLRRPRAERVIRYYAYVPDAQDPAASRGESVSFLHDICLSLQQAGVSTEGTHLPSERELLLDRFYRQLSLLGEEYRTSGRRTIILIDGLDHIDREMRPTRSLLADLPRPDQVPDGVFLVLGSQTDQFADLIERIRHALDQEDRRIHIDRMDRTAVRDVLQDSGLRVHLTSAHLDQVYDLSDGHPLALGYLIQALRGVTEAGQVESVLGSAEPYHGDIEAQYRTYWQPVQSNTVLVRLLAAVARLRGGADLDLLTLWYGQEAVRRLIQVFRRYFVAEPDGRWRFFHNSFRVFLCRETARGYSGEFQEELDWQAHLDLAQRFAAEPAASPNRWEELYHRVSAGDHEGVCRIATHDHFRRQILALRPLDAVRTDIEIAFPSAAARDDVRAYAAMTLSQAEVAQRGRLLADLDLPGLLLDLGDIGLAVEAARDGNRLRVGVTRALELAVQLDREGEAAEARRLFELAEPLDLLADQGGRGTAVDGWRVVDSWAASAPRFRPLREILDILAAAPLTQFRYGNSEAAAEDRLSTRLLTTVGFTLIATSRWSDLEAVLARLPGNEIGREARFWLLYRACEASSGDKRRQFLETLRRDFQSAEFAPEQRLYLADAVLQHSGEEAGARELIAGLPLQMPDLDQPGQQGRGFHPFTPLLMNARLLYQLGETRTAMQMVPDGAVTDRGGSIWFLRDVVLAARIWAKACLGHPLSSWDVRQEVMGVMQRFNRTFERNDEWLGWRACREARGELYRLLVRAVGEHGADALRALRDEFERQWQGETKQYWPPGIRRQVALAFAETHEEHRQWAAGQLHSIEESLSLADLHDLVRETHEQARAWIALGETEAAVRVVHQVVLRANGIIGEDYEFNAWLDWLGSLATTDRSRALGLLDWLARAVVVLKETAESRVGSSAAYRLIRVAARLDPGRCVALSRWLMDQAVIDQPDRIKAFLEGVLESPEFPDRLAIYALADLVVPFDTMADEELPRAVVLAAHRVAGRQIADWGVEYIARRVATSALPSVRAGWDRGIRGAAAQLGGAIPFPMPAAEPARTGQRVNQDDLVERRPPDRLVLEDASELSLEDVLTQGTDMGSLTRLASQERYESAFDWTVVIDRLANVSLSQLRPLVRISRILNR